mmetsp:Transcript_56979/g.127232  ORF Transcript_56979/g.127232 Transcript_56979/m.127232 type:complete len:226 (-) Transcript_56979:540-1217(-)
MLWSSKPTKSLFSTAAVQSTRRALSCSFSCLIDSSPTSSIVSVAGGGGAAAEMVGVGDALTAAVGEPLNNVLTASSPSTAPAPVEAALGVPTCKKARMDGWSCAFTTSVVRVGAAGTSATALPPAPPSAGFGFGFGGGGGGVRTPSSSTRSGRIVQQMLALRWERPRVAIVRISFSTCARDALVTPSGVASMNKSIIFAMPVVVPCTSSANRGSSRGATPRAGGP